MSVFRSAVTVTRPLQQAIYHNTPRTLRPITSLPQVLRSSNVRTTVKLPVRNFSVLHPRLREEPSDAPSPSGIPPPNQYVYQDIAELVSKPSPKRILVDVREPSELLQTGRIPTAKSVPISSAPDAFFLNEEDFDTKFGFPRPGQDVEVIFYCRSGVRSRQASLLASQARPTFGGTVGNYAGSWLDWEKNGGKAEKEGEQGEESSVSGVTNPGQGTPGAPRP